MSVIVKQLNVDMSTVGQPIHADTHPFVRELNGRDLCFAQNGSVSGLKLALPPQTVSSGRRQRRPFSRPPSGRAVQLSASAMAWVTAPR
jgi:hypothetical protein